MPKMVTSITKYAESIERDHSIGPMTDTIKPPQKILLGPGETDLLDAQRPTSAGQHISVELSAESRLVVENLRCTLEVSGAGTEGIRATVRVGENAEVALLGAAAGLAELRLEIGPGACLDLAPSCFADPAGPVLRVVFESEGSGCLAAAWHASHLTEARLHVAGMMAGDALNLAYVNSAGGIHAVTGLGSNAAGRLRPTFTPAISDAPFPIAFADLSGESPMRWEEDAIAPPPRSAGLLVVSGTGEQVAADDRPLFCGRVPHALRSRLSPVRIEAGALAHGEPAHPITLAPWQALKVHGTALYAHQLVNGRTVTQTDHWHWLQYAVPVALEKNPSKLAGVLLLPENAHAAGGPSAARCRQRLLNDAARQSGAALVSEPALRLEFNGLVIHGTATSSGLQRWRFTLPSVMEPSAMRILSRSSVARETSALALNDRRILGVALESIGVLANGEHRSIDVCHPAWSGMHAPTVRHGQTLRWTNGMAALPYDVHKLRGGEILELHVAETGYYWLENGCLPAGETS